MAREARREARCEMAATAEAVTARTRTRTVLAGLALGAVVALAGGCGGSSASSASSSPSTTAASTTSTTAGSASAASTVSGGSGSLDCAQAAPLWSGVVDGAAHAGAAAATANGVDAAVASSLQTMAQQAQQLVAMLPDPPAAATTWLQANQQFAAQAATLAQQHGSVDQFNAMMGQVGDAAYDASVSQMDQYLKGACPGQSF